MANMKRLKELGKTLGFDISFRSAAYGLAFSIRQKSPYPRVVKVTKLKYKQSLDLPVQRPDLSILSILVSHHFSTHDKNK